MGIKKALGVVFGAVIVVVTGKVLWDYWDFIPVTGYRDGFMAIAWGLLTGMIALIAWWAMSRESDSRKRRC